MASFLVPLFVYNIKVPKWAAEAVLAAIAGAVFLVSKYMEPRDAYCVFVVLDPGYGDRLFELLQRGPVWIVDTPQNREAAQRFWTEDKVRSHLEGVTTFKSGDCSSEDALINEIEAIDLHHGIYSADPPYTKLE